MSYSLTFLGNSVLKQKAVRQPEGAASNGLRYLVEGMQKILRENNGLGLAAQQVGSTRRVAILKLQDGNSRAREEVVAVNLDIIDKSDAWEISVGEGCLSVSKDGEYFRTSKRRAVWVRIRYQTLGGEVVERRLEGLDAIIAQHEHDHLEGVCIVDGLSRNQRRAAERLVGIR